jgi:hypothetical protein
MPPPRMIPLAMLLTALSPAAKLIAEELPLIPGSKWTIHDELRPQPAVVTPGTFPSPEVASQPPSDALVLFDGTGTSHWKHSWKVEKRCMIAGPPGDNESREVFGDIQVHVEWAEPIPPQGSSQDRGNSGVFLMGRYELQVLDCFKNQTYPDGQCGAIYGQTPPLVNCCRPPGEWQSYDIFWTSPRFAGQTLESPAYITVMQNGVLVQNHTKVTGSTDGIGGIPWKHIGSYSAHGNGPITLQFHGNPVRYRSVWVRDIKAIDAP